MSEDEAVAEAVVIRPEDSPREVLTDESDEANGLVESVDADDEDTETAESEDTVTDEDKSEPDDSSASKKDDGFQKRIDELTQRFYQEKEQREHFQRQWEDSQQVEQVNIQDGPKTLADFEYDEPKYAEYWNARSTARAKADVERGAQQQAERQRHMEFQGKETAFAANVDDYYAVAHHSPISPDVARIVQSADKAPELAYYLGRNPETAVALSRMHPIDAARELGKIEATKLVRPKPSTTKPPAVVPKISASDTSQARVKADSPDGDKLSDADWLKRRNKQIASRN